VSKPKLVNFDAKNSIPRISNSTANSVVELESTYGHGTDSGVSVPLWLVHDLLSTVSILTCTQAREYPYFATFLLALGFSSVAWSSLKSFVVLLQTFVLPGINVCPNTYLGV
jgi:hypothetical protein